jgi:hypothetical protein
MIWDADTVFVLGAGFTKAFVPQAPLLVDDFGGEQLKRRFAEFPEALSVLELELGHPDHALGSINLERLMTRLAGRMPYDLQTDGDKPLGLLLAALKNAFADRLQRAKASGFAWLGELRLFAGHCLKYGINCITFNYDDVLDKALLGDHPQDAWSPDSGYGFPCRFSEGFVSGTHYLPTSRSAMLLLKLHGSVNWRIRLGHPSPYSVDSVMHHEDWYHPLPDRLDLPRVAQFFEKEPLLVPPVLTKTDLVDQPILRLLWSLALNALKRAKRVAFIGYSLPLTDIAASFLFREGMSHAEESREIAVVDFAGNDEQKREKLPRLLTAYRNVFPHITEAHFDFSGGAGWVRDNLTTWLYDSRGTPIAFEALGHIVSRDGNFIGTIRNYFPGRDDIWHGHYKGEIVSGNRLLRADPPPTEDRGGPQPPPLPEVPRVPESIAPMTLPQGYRDLDIAANGDRR